MAVTTASRKRHSRSRRKVEVVMSDRARRRQTIRRTVLLTVTTALVGIGIYLWDAGVIFADKPPEVWYDVKLENSVLVNLPADDAPHQTASEWWYYNGHLQTESGKHYAFHYVVFLTQRLKNHTIAHVSFTNKATGKYFAHQKRTAGNPSHGTVDLFYYTLGDWLMSGGDGKDKLRVNTPEFSFDLHLRSSVPTVFQGGTGLLDFKQAGESYYYTRPRMKITGIAGPMGKEERVSGIAWFDHQWGDFYTTDMRYNWFALQLDDGADIMIFEITSQGKPILFEGTYTKAGKTSVINNDQFNTQATSHWTSKKSGVRYPMGWKVNIPDRDVALTLVPIIQTSEFDGISTMLSRYWEGAVKISGTQTGQGFVEMHGYDRDTKFN